MSGAGTSGQNLEHTCIVLYASFSRVNNLKTNDQTDLILGPKVSRSTTRYLTPVSMPWGGAKVQNLAKL